MREATITFIIISNYLFDHKLPTSENDYCVILNLNQRWVTETFSEVVSL